MLRKLMITSALCIFCSNLYAAEIITLSRFQVGKDKWAFKREEIMLRCDKVGALFVINPNTLMQYPLNNSAIQQMQRGEVKAEPINVIQLDDIHNPNKKMDLSYFVDRAQQLCDK